MTTNKMEYGLRNFLRKNKIYSMSLDMQTVIINSFFVSQGGDNEAPWSEKIKFTQDRFASFANYAKTWKTPIA